MLIKVLIFQTQHLDSHLQLPLLRLMVPPLRLLTAAMWQVAQQGDVQHYGMLDEFVATVTECVPELLSYRQRAQLILGVRARLILELCRGESLVDMTILQPHLDRLRAPSASKANREVPDKEVEEAEANFRLLIQTLLKDPAERDHFFQNIFPVEYGYKYAKALQRLMLDLVSRLEQLLPVPDLTQLVSWFSSNPSSLEECLLSVPLSSQTKNLLEHHRSRALPYSIDSLPSTGDDYILSSLSLSPLVRVVIASEQSEPDSSDDITSADSPVDLSREDHQREPGSSWRGQRDRGDDESNDNCSKSDDCDAQVPVVSCRARPSTTLSPSPALLDLSLKGPTATSGQRKSTYMVVTGNCTSEENTRLKGDQKKTLNEQRKFAEKRKLTEDSSEVALKRPSKSQRIRDYEKPSAESSVIYPWGGYTDLQDPTLPHTTSSDVSKIPWSDQETLNLMDIWGQGSIQRSLKDCVHNRHIFNVISKKMLERGHMRTAEQCHTRIKRLKMSFKQCHESNVKGGERLECKFYAQLEKILVAEGTPTPSEVTCDVQEVVVGDQPPARDQPIRDAKSQEENELKFLGHTCLEGTKNIPWMDHETQTLIEVWGEDRTQQELRGIHRNGHIFSMISRKMATFGYVRTAEQCQSRVKRLKLSFRQCYENNHTPGKERVECKFYEQLERLLLNETPSDAEGTSSTDPDAEGKDLGETDNDFPGYSYQEMEASFSGTDERKKVAWSDSETLSLLELWGDEKVQRSLQRCPHNSHIYTQISEQLHGRGYSRTAEQCHTRIKRLKLSYRQCRESMSSPEAEPVEFKFYDLMEDILNKYPPCRKASTNNAIHDSFPEKDGYVLCSPTPMDKSSPSGTWSEPETLALIDIWAQDEVQRGLKDVLHSGTVFSDVSQRLLNLGYSKSPEQCRWKFKTLRQDFRQCHERRKHGGKPVLCRYYRFLEPILGHVNLSSDSGDLSHDGSIDTPADSDQDTESQQAARKRRAMGESSPKVPWSDRETRALLGIWGEDRVQCSLRGCLKNRHIFRHISRRLRTQGFTRTAQQCQTRVKRLKARFFHDKEDCKFYGQLEQIFLKEISSSSLSEETLDMPGEREQENSEPGCTKSPAAGPPAPAPSGPDLPATPAPPAPPAPPWAPECPKLPWTDSETQALIDIWGSDGVQSSLSGCVKNKHIFTQISRAMAERGYARTAEQCQSRVKRLKTSYRQCAVGLRSGGDCGQALMGNLDSIVYSPVPHSIPNDFVLHVQFSQVIGWLNDHLMELDLLDLDLCEGSLACMFCLFLVLSCFVKSCLMSVRMTEATPKTIFCFICNRQSLILSLILS
ncbi:uncharacterized protein zgc:113263, partial [Engraulis encrasicolus]|uniref:uncharacterized protein zgc:113263 n=1 Tax=Engraulis encrasicolus TaxID=184585 RepID=UPI002FD2D6ED